MPYACAATVGLFTQRLIHNTHVLDDVPATLRGVDAAAAVIEVLAIEFKNDFVPKFGMNPVDATVERTESIVLCWWAPAFLHGQRPIDDRRLEATM